ncbi:MAG: DUF3592 domain-containing protein [Ruminococcus sp.]|nr:DUF3592 domain-containing protein [Ruminococcus sp.]
MNPTAFGLALILVGIITVAMGALNVYYNMIVFRETEEFDAVVTKIKLIKGKRSTPYDAFQVYAEYSVNGVLIKGYYYTILQKHLVKCNVGDNIVIQANPNHPNVFMIQDIECTQEMENTRKRSPILVGFGLVLIVAAILILILK